MDVGTRKEGRNATPQVSSSLEDMPEEILELIRIQQTPQFLELLATNALQPKLTLKLFTLFELVFADTCARWMRQIIPENQNNEIIEAFAQFLPLAPHLSVYLETYLTNTTRTLATQSTSPRIHSLDSEHADLSELHVSKVQQILLAAFRLLNFDKNTFSTTISSTSIQCLFSHDDVAVRYLAIRIFCMLLSASDVKLESLIQEHIGDVVPWGDFDGKLIDMAFLSLAEETRLQNAHGLLSQYRQEGRVTLSKINLDSLSPESVRCAGVLLPRPKGLPAESSSLVPTQTTLRNVEAFAKSLLQPSPILLHGLAGSGKTSIVNDFGRELGMDKNMVSLHLNEQTDAKMLIGMYATGSTPGSFTWRPGVLTTAVREGRWVFIEDLDRAPNEVISVILPLIECGELVIPSRGETIKAASGFKLLASIRTSLNVTGHENPPSIHMLGSRLWQRVPVQMPSLVEFREIIQGTHPILHKFLPGIIMVYERLYALSNKPMFASRSRTSLGRPISSRDLLKWCRRLDVILHAAGSKTGEEPVTESTKYEMFLEATDCFAGSLQTDDARRTIISSIAEEMHIDPQRVEHFLDAHTPRYEDAEDELIIGRVRLSKRRSSRITKPAKKSRPFANTNHAKRLLEQVGRAVTMAEPVLLVGETGIGKTTVVQKLADSLGFSLTAVNLSQQSEVGDLLGGFKPVNIRSLAMPLKDEFDELFAATGISVTKNQKYIEQLGRCVARSQWNRALRLWREAPKMFDKIMTELKRKEEIAKPVAEQPTKRRKTESRLQFLLHLKPRWERFSESLDQLDVQLSGGSKGFAFTFVEGNIVKAARNGDWVLLDEINLASPDTLESIADLLHSGSGSAPSILLSETGEIERVQAHPNFRIFGAMNPATDVGKRDLPMSLRSRFTELYVDSPDRNLDDLLGVIKAYLKGTSSNDEKAAHDVARLYLNTKQLADEKRLVDGANQVPHFSLRTLTRVLSYVTEIAPSYGLRRALYEGFAMGFLTLLDRESEKMLMPLINHHILDSRGNAQSLLSQTPRHPDDGKQYVRFKNGKKDRQYWMLQGTEPPQKQHHYIITPFVERNMLNLVRATSTRRFPVLVQGPTSSGKTSMIEYLAKFSGNKFVRINNHEHTDLQEYLGTYISGSDGQLRFREGLLVQALRQGHWIVLDELNLAPTDVLEALNRLLDDNRELLIPETQEIVRPHENFMLFATQNPPGLYGGRKTLSRAFRNRFLELHFDDIPEDELDFILEKRSQKVAPSDCRRIVVVYKELSRLRQSNRLFEQKDSFATLRDLFRWALRDTDNRDQLAANGYMLLAERVRNSEERVAVKQIIERVMKVKLDPAVLYDDNLCPEIKEYNSTENAQGVVWTQAMRRLYVLVVHALRNNEPVLLVGETGCGKTTVCQMLAEAFRKDLNIVNAHQNTETGDLIGAQRPVRNRAAVLGQLEKDLVSALKVLGRDLGTDANFDDILAAYTSLPSTDIVSVPQELRDSISSLQSKAKALFEWSDGSLVHAMKQGQFFLLDEISLADDSVLERLNSVLETQRTILLAEKGVEDSFVQAKQGFQFFATMNPGGDYGKRELSPALRNRFTEIWVPSLSELEDVLQIVETKLAAPLKIFAKPIVLFSEWFGQTYRSTSSTSISVRDILAWIKFINGFKSPDPYFLILHGAAMVYIDTLGANPSALLAINPGSIQQERSNCLSKLGELLAYDVASIYTRTLLLSNTDDSLSIGCFSINKQPGAKVDPGFAFHAPTTKLNGMRLLRALQVQKPILIEGSPGVGKTTLVAALARACNQPLTRINLSEQTDLMDLFGSDVPVEGAEAGHFAWRDAPFLQAMQKGEWVLLDEMNLASQSVLEGLNACLDHRGEVYISELDQTFKRHANFTVFAAQNPHHQGGGRKGLPSSFVNRFTVVYADVFRVDDLELICRHNFPAMPKDVIHSIISFVSHLEQEVVYKRTFGSQGGPWEFNLRDVLRWLQLLSSPAPLLSGAAPADFLNLIFRQKFRSTRDREEIDKTFAYVFGSIPPFRHLFHNLSSEAYQVGMAYTSRNLLTQASPFPPIDSTKRLAEVESVMMCIQQNMPCILVGPSGSGKTTLLQHIAAACGKPLVIFPLNSDVDTMDLVGGFEQVDPQRGASAFLKQLKQVIGRRVLLALPAQVPTEALTLIERLQTPSIATPSLFSELTKVLENLAQQTSLPEFNNLASTCKHFAEKPLVLENARFEWVDGVLVKALESGDWLVLDNANLCSASVLDRLNSLLEPNGVLSINEHCGPEGEPKVVRPHPEFRIFLTMDARHGELSRAMRNRAIELFLEPVQNMDAHHPNFLVPEASLQRYQRFARRGESFSDDILQIEVENLAWSDMTMLTRYMSFLASNEATGSPKLFTFAESVMQIYQTSDYRELRTTMGEMLSSIAQRTALPSSFRDAQIVHPLQNSPLISMLKHSNNDSQACWLGACFDLSSSFTIALHALRDQDEAVKTVKPRMMNRLQRSLVQDRVPAVAKDSTVNIVTFLTSLWTELRTYVQAEIKNFLNWKVQKNIIFALQQYWWDTFRLATSTNFDEASFQAHLAIGSDLLVSLSTSLSATDCNTSIVSNVQRQIRSNFDATFKLTTGLSMEIMWKALRPTVIPSLQVMDTLARMESLAERFDTLRWQTTISTSELAKITRSLISAYHHLLTSGTDGKTLLESIDTELAALEAKISGTQGKIEPFLSAEFESLRKFKVLSAILSNRSPAHDVDEDMIVFSNHPTVSEMRVSSSTESSRLFQSIDYLSCQRGDFEPISRNLSADLIRKLSGMKDVDLKSLRLLEAELPTMGEQLSTSTATLARDQLDDLNGVLFNLLSSIFLSHSDEMAAQYKQWYQHLGTQKQPDLSSVTEPAFFQRCKSEQVFIGMPTHFKNGSFPLFASASIAIASSKQGTAQALLHSAVAWVQLAIGALILFVPDRAFDPDKRQRLERERHRELRQKLQDKISTLKRFEEMFTGQTSNLRIQLLEDDVSKLGDEPMALQEICRPQVSEIDQLQGEFNILLKTIIKPGLQTSSKIVEYGNNGDSSALLDIQMMQNNADQITRRLSQRFRAYTDLTAPVVNLLRCLEIGLAMATQITLDPSSNSESVDALSKVTPFLGGGPIRIEESVLSEHPMEFLALASTTASMENLSSSEHYGFGANERQTLFKTFHNCYENWTKRLESDRLEAESKSGLYRFKGSAEDEEEEDAEQFNELFPTFDSDTKQSSNLDDPSAIARDTAIKLADVHASVFVDKKIPSESILLFMKHMASRISAVRGNAVGYDPHASTSVLLPGALLLLDDRLEALTSSASVSSSYNFYADSHLPEIRKLVTLIHQIQARFIELQAVDEIGHMQPLADVLVSCGELIQFRYTEPLAKVITKVEQIHTFMHEWQFGGWASRANSALTQYDSLTATIISWRRLELSTWSKLFDMESKKCEDDARSWWFVAYQVVIAAPLQISEKEDELKVYAQKLLQDLEVYFSTAVMGQIVQRLHLLKQLQKHLELLVLDVPLLAIIYAALSNFVAIYSKYEKPVQEHLKKGRVSLEKAMRDVLLMASWKDTNIVALRDSAKRSHHNLFKIVRKFRALLGQPMDSLIKQGLPEEQSSETSISAQVEVRPDPLVVQSALTHCAKSLPTWSQKSKRFMNVSKTVSMMVDACQVPESMVDGPSYLDSFLGNILTSTAELQKATPSILTEENKVDVKHLKSRKRKLFADTLKELRQMGISYNLGVDALAKQNSLSKSLVDSGSLSSRVNLDIPGLEYYFHRAIDLVPRAREAARQPSEDLSSVEVARSSGFLEGMLQVLISQHSVLSTNASRSAQLEAQLATFESLWAPGKYGFKLNKYATNHERLLRWLPNILDVGVHLIELHSKLGKIVAGDVKTSLQTWKGKFVEHVRQWDELAQLPGSTISTQRLELQKTIDNNRKELRCEIQRLIDSRSDLKFVLQQIIPWTIGESRSINYDGPSTTIEQLDTQLSSTCDLVLAAIEKYKKAIQSVPGSSDEPGWLLKHDNTLASAINSLHSHIIIQKVGESFGSLQQHLLSQPRSNPDTTTAGALFAVAAPILQQYVNILQQSIGRYAQLHRATCKASYILSKTFIQIATQGFCTPSENSDSQDGQTEKLEGGTGLGDGEGAEDISKDIQDDENLDELAQEPNTGEKGDMENEQDAVDMADGELEGEMGEGDEKGSDDEGSDGESQNGDEMDEEAGDVDDLDPTAVDERMWDGDGEQADKDQEGDDSKGKASKDEQVAAQENDKQTAEGDEGESGDEEEMGADQGEEVKQDDTEKHDPHAQEGEALDLPDDMELDGDEEEKSVDGSDDGMNDLSDAEQDGKEDDVQGDGEEEAGAENMDAQEDQEIGSDMDLVDLDEEQNEEGEKTEEAGEKNEEDEEQQPDNDEGLLRDRNDDANADADNAVPSDVQGTGEDQDDNATEDKNESTSKAQRDDGGKGGDSSEKKDAAAEDGEQSRQANGEAPQDSRDETQDSASAQPFKKLGEALEKWHRQQTKIREPAEQKEADKDQNMDVNPDSTEFQHLQDENAQADTQALGTATEDQAKALDESMAVDSESKDMPEQFQPDEVEKNDINMDDALVTEEPSTSEEQDTSDAYEGRAGAMIKQAKEDRDTDIDESRGQRKQDLEEDVEEVDNQLESTHIDENAGMDLRSTAAAREEWTHYEASTRDLSLSLTEQLRLILAPTLATKMRGDFRTGKRLNIKRIIPYIASQYKRDKIWMRRSVPSKRSYQIMLAVDDSKSMGESGSGSLAFETLVMVSKSLSMLEVGEICVVGFGDKVKVAHDFDTPFSSDAGPKIFQNFGFEQSRTDITRLVRETIDLFRAARAKASGSPADLWQMELIISDGVCDSSEHESIRRLLREAIEERIMMVFVIVDDVRNKKKGESVMDLKEAKFVKDENTGVSNVRIERYLDTFPFQYYLIVSDVRELPGVLATLLRQWFAEVVDSSR